MVRPTRLHPSTQLSAAEWLIPRLRPFAEHRVASLVPDGFPAYVRILHPAQGNRVSVRWAEVAVRSGRTLHRLAQFASLARPSSASSRDSVGNLQPPESGHLPPDLLKALCEGLAQQTSTPDSCWFCLWDGYGWLASSPAQSNLSFTPSGQTVEETSSFPVPPLGTPEVRGGPKLPLPARNYYLLHGPLLAALDLGWMLTADHFIPQSPNLFWPQDQAWCVASEVDLLCTLVAGSEALIGSLVADPRLEAWRVFADDSVTWNSDEINT